jgi:2-oxoglutarate ferredoxin oxidoreductase subunit delta
VLAMSEEFNSKGYHPPKVVRSQECIDCNLCEMICPDFAIYSSPLPERTAVAETVESAQESMGV